MAAHRNSAEVGAIGKPQGESEKQAGVPVILRGGASTDFDSLKSGQDFRDKLMGGR